MPYSEAQKKASMKWMAENCDRVYLRVPKGYKQKIEEAAKAQGYESKRAFILDAIEEKMNKGK